MFKIKPTPVQVTCHEDNIQAFGYCGPCVFDLDGENKLTTHVAHLTKDGTPSTNQGWRGHYRFTSLGDINLAINNFLSKSSVDPKDWKTELKFFDEDFYEPPHEMKLQYKKDHVYMVYQTKDVKLEFEFRFSLAESSTTDFLAYAFSLDTTTLEEHVNKHFNKEKS